ncbi:hypothetical protein BDP27DRAFT_527085 [Rhodocollybia butyracea]|uniref:Uncharacterized protein n=1 Tax=Rhodocollybia butyracea TaxID=206335 RepID=A0A9P5U9U6_9AGAR|nr:hypothetical protein BDP27DRAFT_527085 [Rhodocollybia butyracea]
MLGLCRVLSRCHSRKFRKQVLWHFSQHTKNILKSSKCRPSSGKVILQHDAFDTTILRFRHCYTLCYNNHLRYDSLLWHDSMIFHTLSLAEQKLTHLCTNPWVIIYDVCVHLCSSLLQYRRFLPNYPGDFFRSTPHTQGWTSHLKCLTTG